MMVDTLQELAMEVIFENLSYCSAIFQYLPPKIKQMLCNEALQRGFPSQYRVRQYFHLDV